MIKKLKIYTGLLSLFISILSFGQHHDSVNESSEKDLKTEIKEVINHHLLDSYEFTLYTDNTTGHSVGFPLPVLLWDNGLQAFWGSSFHHGEDVAEINGNHYALYHGKIYKTDALGSINLDEHHHPVNAMPFDLSVTKNVFCILLISILLFFMLKGLAKSYNKRQIPTGLGRLLEPLIIFIRDEVAIPNIGEKNYGKYMGYLLTIFFFIVFLNLAGLTPFGINVTGNIAVTFALAFFTFVITQFTANSNYWKHIFWMPGVPIPMKILLAPIEVLGIFIKPFALMIRLYANISAGHIVLMSMVGLLFVFHNWFARGAFIGLSLFLSLIEVLVAFLQAYIFTMLSAVYFGFAVAEHEEH